MRFHREAIKIEEAQRRIMLWAAEGPIERVTLLQSVGRSLAEDVIACHSVPHFRRSGMDGYAIQSSDSIRASQQNSIELEVVEEVPCGVIPTQQIRQGTASRIMTGASIPDGADAVIMLEMIETIERNGKIYIIIKKELRAGENVADIGVEITEGNALIEKGATIGEGEVAILATFGKSEVTVYKQPVVMIFSTGTELLNLTDPLQPGKIRNSNSYMVAAQVYAAGGIPIVMNHIPDDINQAKETILKGLAEADVVITTGGVSVGDYDILVDLFEQWKGELLFNKIAMRPGSPTSVGVLGGKLLFALSGNPGACHVGFELFVRPAIMKLQGIDQCFRPTFTATLTADYTKGIAFTRLIRGKSNIENGKAFVDPVGKDQSSMMVSIKDSNCLIIIPPGGRGKIAGDSVTVIQLNER